MESHRDATEGGPRTVPVQRDFLFVDAAQAKTSRQGRKNARSFVMQKARRERPWSTSKHSAKQRKVSESTSPGSAGTPDSLLTPKTATPSPPLQINRSDYFTVRAGQRYVSATGETCPDCKIFVCRPGQALCPRCCLLQPVTPVKNPNNSLFDPFGTSSVETNGSVSELLEHCKYPGPCCLFHVHLVDYRDGGTAEAACDSLLGDITACNETRLYQYHVAELLVSSCVT
jgi:hypothetical protein